MQCLRRLQAGRAWLTEASASTTTASATTALTTTALTTTASTTTASTTTASTTTALTTTASAAPCNVCLGLLSASDDAAMLERIAQTVQQEDYDCPTFSLALTVPMSVHVRQRAILANLRTIPDATVAPEGAVVEIKEALKTLLVPRLEKCTGKVLDGQSPLLLHLQFEHPASADEHLFLTRLDEADLKSSDRKRRKVVVTPGSGAGHVIETLQQLTDEQMQKLVTCPPTTPAEPAQLMSIKLTREPVFIAGRYNKFVRTLSQTAWHIEGNQRMTENSVAELISAPLLRSLRADDVTFQSSGREDLDVRMLGSGRPFVLSFMNARSTRHSNQKIAELEREINETCQGRIAVQDLQFVTKANTQALKDGEETKQKTYRCVVWCSRDLTETDVAKLQQHQGLVIQQETPIRVLHRRTGATRSKTIHSIRAELVNRRFLILDLTTQAGTYIKEFVHGDFGRTVPNIGTLLDCTADILQLDVTEVHLEWPPRV